MFRNYLTIALRNFRRQKGFTFINILGLAVGLASATAIFLFIFDELGYDRFHPDAKNIYVLGTKGKFNGEEESFNAAPGAWVKAMKERYPEVTDGLQTFWAGFPASFRDPETDKILLTEKELWVAPNFSSFFYFPLIKGDPAHAFTTPNSVVLSESTAKRFFGDRDPIGKTLQIKHTWVTNKEYVPLMVSGVMKDYPNNSHMHPDYLINLDMLRNMATANGNDWYSNWGNKEGWFNTYLHTNDQFNADKISKSFDKVIQANLPKDPNAVIKPYLVPLTDLHYNEPLRSTILASGDIKYVYIFGSIAVLIVLIASINYMNLATARAFRRAKEIGLRKVMGSNRQQLIIQFLSEAIITAFLALLLALVMVILLLPLYNTLAGKHFAIIDLFQGKLLLSLVGITLLVALLSGSYPALYLSNFKPITVLKNTRFTGRSSEILRKALIVMQYTITMVLIIGTLVMARQMEFIRHSALSKSGDQMLSIRFGMGMMSLDKFKAFKHLVQQDPEMQHVTIANHLPRLDFFGPIDSEVRFPDLGNQPRNWFTLNGDYDFPRTFGLEVIAGRNFDIANPADSNAFLINETGIKTLGLNREKVLGLTLQTGNEYEGRKVTGKIIGVVKDFNYRSVHQAIEPLLINARPHVIDQIVYVKLPADKIQEKIATLEHKWKEVLPGMGFDHWFVSQEFGRMYEAEMRMAGLFKSFSGLAIFIACLGLFGLSSYLSERRTKEIGIRKVMGASVPQILQLLFSTFLKLLIIACLVAVPLSWFATNRWLENFTYRVEVEGIIFLISILLVLLLTVLTVSYETIRAARANPVDSLRYE
ncbi:MAG: FtsX-like permease family protein [Bacteroidota bacterium]